MKTGRARRNAGLPRQAVSREEHKDDDAVVPEERQENMQQLRRRLDAEGNRRPDALGAREAEFVLSRRRTDEMEEVVRDDQEHRRALERSDIVL